ncbi:50S ribosomal protein L1 [Dehalogenimonas etheniformans]|uniref:Large ribosomal subunit protein uL1 n=1 Tax=Dehalogenimonas etheniformans TaxID=1536648 RepID=A0A2P5P8T3_9CHLR|nr:50S ribosomal protein L1 [Dehalogenimonas etheniformans]PPD58708.1 50S ribosomal protein L1 [Dehalogenimonas etheniformans]QNT76525.1 50S ribosomal protein L1 [Dehalogenimonas etheniformans]
MVDHGKRFDAVEKLVEAGKEYTPAEAIALAKKAATAKFDETVEVHLRMGLDPRNSAQVVRGVALMPAGLGKKVRVLVFAQGDAEKIARDAGADFVGADDLVAKINEGWTEFDMAIATPDMMGKVGKLGKVLGRKGLMPNPKAGTVVAAGDLPQTIKEARMGRVEFKLDRSAIIHTVLGKASFDEAGLMQNLTSLMEAIVRAKPSGAKGQYIKSVYVTTTMGPGFKLDLRPTMALGGA